MVVLHSKLRAGDKVKYLGINVTVDKVNADENGYWYLLKWNGESGPVTCGVRESVLCEDKGNEEQIEK